MSPLAFVPRKLAKSVPRAAPTTLASAKASSSQNAEPHPVAGADAPTTSKRRKGDKAASDADYAALVSMSLSDHALWLDPDLRRISDDADANEGFLSLSRLVERSPHFAHLKATSGPVELALVKAIRSQLDDAFETRMLLADPVKSNWYRRDERDVKDAGGGYEIRPRDWQARASRFERYNKDYWEKRTVYIENTPTQFLGVAKMCRLVSSFLRPPSTDDSPVFHPQPVHTVSLPRHHLDKPGDEPKCKGFALVTLSRLEDVDALLVAWPWPGIAAPSVSGSTGGDLSPTARECAKFGFRTMGKSRWDALRAEYLSYRARLLDDIAAFDAEDPDAEPLEPSSAQEQLVDGHTSGSTVEPQPPASTVHLTKDVEPLRTKATSPYPFGCLVLVKNVHPQTNKTTLRKLFAPALSAFGEDAIDYVDFTKGLDSCYLRLAGGHISQAIVDHFEERSLVQANGLDDTGQEISENTRSSRITAEVVGGVKEQLYWEKVPEKLRRQAVEKTLGFSNAEGGRFGETEETGGKRKRRRRGQ